MKIYQPSKDETAFLYQQAFELEPFVKNLGSLSVLVEEVENKLPLKKASEPDALDKMDTDYDVATHPELDSHHFAVTFVVAPESMQMSVRGLGNSLVEATIAAKDEARKQLGMLVNSIPMENSGIPHWLH